MPPKPKFTLDPSFKPGSTVEISSDDEGFRGSWFLGTIVRRCSSKGSLVKFLVEYKTIMEDEKGSKPLSEMIDLSQLRPEPPRETDRDFKFGEDVDAYYNDGWWEGTITEQLENGKFGVFFRTSREQLEFRKEDLRLHREWVNGTWIPPLEEEKASITTEVKLSKTMTREKFSRGKVVEVSSDEDGFQGAWFAATIIEPKGKDVFLVEYQALRTDDDSEFLREEIDTKHIRPYPPETLVVDPFNLLEEVDALYNDGWWVGVISKVLSKSRYIVYFKSTNEEMEFQHSQLRLHQDWIDGKWMMASKALKL
ncbi:Agenet-like domain containing protein [Quillaja saponaria]|uniref:Agenet-like domain containing protein n=1 Tax=Quillaja saponaria TaxID=32244 RepID=A0AAD7VJH8_QUISA|nr:Agenet-like domain containing protein [Quillaja saponaria]